jgi:hypothetical protein
MKGLRIGKMDEHWGKKHWDNLIFDIGNIEENWMFHVAVLKLTCYQLAIGGVGERSGLEL